MRRPAALVLGVGLTLGAAPPAHADDPVDQIGGAGGTYQPGAASLTAADCSGLVSVAQTLAMGQAPHRLGNTSSLLAGRWPGAIPGATPDDVFVIGTSSTHMVASVHGVNIEARQSGEHFRIGPAAASPFDRQFTRRYHVDPALLGVVAPNPSPAPLMLVDAPAPWQPDQPPPGPLPSSTRDDPYTLQPAPD